MTGYFFLFYVIWQGLLKPHVYKPFHRWLSHRGATIQLCSKLCSKFTSIRESGAVPYTI